MAIEAHKKIICKIILLKPVVFKEQKTQPILFDMDCSKRVLIRAHWNFTADSNLKPAQSYWSILSNYDHLTCRNCKFWWDSCFRQCFDFHQGEASPFMPSVSACRQMIPAQERTKVTWEPTYLWATFKFLPQTGLGTGCYFYVFYSMLFYF